MPGWVWVGYVTVCLSHISSQLMLMDSSMYLPSPVLAISSPTNALLMEVASMGLLSGGWMGAVSVHWYMHQQVILLAVDHRMSSQLHLDLGLEQVLPLIHQH